MIPREILFSSISIRNAVSMQQFIEKCQKKCKIRNRRILTQNVSKCSTKQKIW